MFAPKCYLSFGLGLLFCSACGSASNGAGDTAASLKGQGDSVTQDAAVTAVLPNAQTSAGTEGLSTGGTETTTAAGCQELSNAAHALYNQLLSDIPLCVDDADCTRTFTAPEPQCWAECRLSASNIGSEAREEAENSTMTGPLVSEACAAFEDESCVILPPGCPGPLAATPAPVLRCDAGQCVVANP